MKSGNSFDMIITPYIPEYKDVVIELWQKCNLTRPWNNPELDIERKLRVNPELFLVGLIDGTVVASVMGGYEGHRGWVNYLAVDPAYQRNGMGREMIEELEKRILTTGCPKINLQIRTDNTDAILFYESVGYRKDEVISMGKRLVDD